MSDVVFDAVLGELRTADKRPTGGGSSASGSTYARALSGTDVPADGYDGDMFYDTDDGILYIYANGQWNAISGGGAPTVDGVYLTEGGDYFITEAGDYLATE
jgi:hypothetical protein